MKDINEDDEVRIIGGADWCPAEGNSGKELLSTLQLDFSARRKHRAWLWWTIGVVTFLTLMAGLGYWGYRSYIYRFGYPISRTPRAVIHALETPQAPKESGISCTVDTILGVPMKFYHISGLKARLTTGLPDIKDKNIYLVTRSADYRYDNDKQKIIGDYVVDGKKISTNGWRAGYFITRDGHVEIGVSRYPDMREYAIAHGASMFRQFALLSAGTLCVSQYVLKGKVSRCAYARTPENELYYVETIRKETLYGFADALAEYGFVDAIYITGGAQADLFYRDAQGLASGYYADDKPHTIVEWYK